MYHGRNNHRRRDNNGGVPPRWLRCPQKSTGFVGDRFLVFKTPLSDQYDDFVPDKFRFKTNMVMQYMKTVNKKLGLWIDLTNTDRYYPKQEVENEGVKYIKLNCQGSDGPPNAEQMNTFVRLCANVINKRPNEMIGVHCTHGFNRSGFLICAYLVQECDWHVSVAVGEFAKSRVPGIYKQDYLTRLYEMFGDTDDIVPSNPPLPEWCFEDQDVHDDDGFSSGRGGQMNGQGSNNNKRSYQESFESSSSNGEPNRKRGREFKKDNPTFMEGVQGVEPVTDPEEHLRIQRKVQDMSEWTRTGFPGSQPISMDVQNIKRLADAPYMVSWKADGTRYLMLIEDRDQVYFVDRDNCVFQVSGMTFPYRKNPAEHLTETLVDGEMVIDKHDGQSFPRYLIYDIIKFRGEEVGKVEFRTRLLCIEKEIVNERYRAIQAGEINRDLEPFGVRLKQFWYLDKTEDVLRGNLTKQLPHEPDGAVFQPIKDPYVPGRCDSVLKWKPPHLNTIDFRLKIVTQTGEGLLPTRLGQLWVGSMTTPFCQLKKVTREVAQLDGKIVECRFDFEQRGWIFLRERTDKSFPNAFTTAQAVFDSIKNPVTLDYLLSFIRHNQYRK